MITSLVPLNGEAFTDEEVQVFETKYLMACEKLSAVVKQKKQLEEQEKEFKKQLGVAMDECGIKSLDNPFIKIIRVAGSSDSVSIDLKAMEQKEPDLYKELLQDYPKVTKGKSASVRFDVK